MWYLPVIAIKIKKVQTKNVKKIEPNFWRSILIGSSVWCSFFGCGEMIYWNKWSVSKVTCLSAPFTMVTVLYNLSSFANKFLFFAAIRAYVYVLLMACSHWAKVHMKAKALFEVSFGHFSLLFILNGGEGPRKVFCLLSLSVNGLYRDVNTMLRYIRSNEV